MKHRENNDISMEIFEEMMKEAMQTPKQSDESFFRIDGPEQLGILSPDEAVDKLEGSNNADPAILAEDATDEQFKDLEEPVEREEELDEVENPVQEQVNGDANTGEVVAKKLKNSGTAAVFLSSKQKN